jgi:uncharacterized phage protein gp47/JayE
MSFEVKKFRDIYEDLQSNTTVVRDFKVGSVVRTMYESFAYEIALFYEKMHLVYLSAFVDSAEGQQLDMVVSVLGIKRGLPDFAEGVVTFERNVGKEDIPIPLGTLVATEDTPENPKKVYQTYESKVLPKDFTSVDVKVQAIKRGEEQATAAETVVVIPRPIPGIKSVINHEALRFLGKRRETDEELRERAKNALISSGKASLVAIENALLSMAGVKDIKVNENFYFAQGTVLLQRISGSGDITIPKNLLLTAHTEAGDKPFKTIADSILPDGADCLTVKVQALLAGKGGELTATGSELTWEIDMTSGAGLETLSVTNNEPLIAESHGIIEVFVDGIDFKKPEEVKRLRDEIDRVRAAGIMVLLKSVLPVMVDGVFRIEIDPALNLSADERTQYEQTVRSEIIAFLQELKMGQPLIFSKLIQRLLSLDGIDNLEDFQIITTRDQVSSGPVGFSDKRIELEEFERFMVDKEKNYICVASEEKKLEVNIQFKAAGLDDATKTAIESALSAYFQTKGLGDIVKKSEIASQINSVPGITLDEETPLKLLPLSWCSRPLLKEETNDVLVEVSFVERAVLGDVFAYHSYLEITGALKLVFPVTITLKEKRDITGEIRTNIERYLEGLISEEDVVLEELSAIAAAVDRVLAVELDPDDFEITLNGAATSGRIPGSKDKIEVGPFEKAQLNHFCITGDEETVNITLTVNEKIGLNLVEPDPLPPDFATLDEIKETIKTAVVNTYNNYLTAVEPGEDLIYGSLKSALENQVPGVSYSITRLSLTATSLCDLRIQNSDIATARNIHIRSVEKSAFPEDIGEGDVDITVISTGQE